MNDQAVIEILGRGALHAPVSNWRNPKKLHERLQATPTKNMRRRSDIELRLIFFCCIAQILLFAGNIKLASATTLSLGTEYSSSYKIAEPTYSPEPEISAELKEQCCKFACTAKFIIKADGKISVSLVSSSGSAEVDDIALTTLRRWRFKPATLDGSPVDSMRRIRVEFEVN